MVDAALKTNQEELLDYMYGLPNMWLSAKDLHSMIKRDKDVSYVSVSRKLERLFHWGLVERKRDEKQKYGYLYRLVEEKNGTL